MHNPPLNTQFKLFNTFIGEIKNGAQNTKTINIMRISNNSSFSQAYIYGLLQSSGIPTDNIIYSTGTSSGASSGYVKIEYGTQTCETCK